MTSVNQVPQSSAAAAKPAGGIFGASDGQFDMFLKLLTTQMQNQDPLDPMDTGEYTQQLAQYSQIEQSIQQTGLLKDLLARMSSSDLTTASGLIGRSAEFNSNTAMLGTSPAQWSWSLPRAAASVSAEIVDGRGRTVQVLAQSPEQDGQLSWTGKLADGTQVAPGAYQLKIVAKDAAGATIPASVRSRGEIVEVSSRGNELWLGLGNGVSLPAKELARVFTRA